MMKEANELSANTRKIALLVSLACVLQICESLIPHPVPGLRLGLANVITLIALDNLGFGYAFEVTILRTLLSSFIMGTFMSPTFILSFAGGLISTLVMGFFYWVSKFHRSYRLSIIGISILGALSHNLTQLYLAYLILVKHPGIFVFLPWLCIGAVVMGWVTGVAGARVCRNLKEMRAKPQLIREIGQAGCAGLTLNHYLPGNSLLHRIPAQVKISGIFILSLVALIFNNFRLCLGLLLFLAALVAFSRTSLAFLFSRAKKYSSLLFVSFLFPVFFNPGKHVLSHIAYLRITSEGLSAGALFAWRVLFLILVSSLLVRTTSPEELAKGFSKVLLPLRPFGISNTRVAGILSLSWVSVPLFWEMARDIIRKTDLKKAKNIANLIPLLSDFIATLYLETEQLAIKNNE